MAIPLLNNSGSPPLFDKNQSPAIENKKAPIINHVSFDGFGISMFRIIMTIIPIPAVPDLNKKSDVINAIIASAAEISNSQ